MTRVTFVIMAGGRGERLWPFVRAATPKVCLSPRGKSTLLQATIERLRPVWPGAEWLIVTTQVQAEAVQASLPAAWRNRIMVEPQGKNTAACITLAAVALSIQDPRRVMVVTPADHWIEQAGVFQRTLRAAIKAAVAEDTIAMIGIRPTQPHPGFGYLCAGPRVQRPHSPRVFRLAKFVEKPSAEAARQLLRRGRVFWNSGTFIGTAEQFLERVTEWLPDHARRLAPLASHVTRRPGSLRNRTFLRRVRQAYRHLEAVSFDHGVMDHLRDGLIVEGRFGWADLGSWDAWAALNGGGSRRVAIDSENVTVVGQTDHLIAAVGVRDLLVVHTPSATLICRPDEAQRVREIVRHLADDPRLAAYR